MSEQAVVDAAAISKEVNGLTGAMSRWYRGSAGEQTLDDSILARFAPVRCFRCDGHCLRLILCE